MVPPGGVSRSSPAFCVFEVIIIEQQFHRIAVKIGTSSLVLPNGQMNLPTIDRLAYVLSALNHQGYEVLLISSGAIGVGLETVGLTTRPKAIAEQQALAAIGQAALMRIYSQRFLDYQTHIAQLLLTRDVFDYQQSRKNTMNTINCLLADRVVPIINENDPISIDEPDHHTTFSDNDELSAIVTKNAAVNLLIVLSDIDAFYDRDPHRYPDAQPIRRVTEITPELKAAASGASSAVGTGGMVTKLHAAMTVMAAGKQMVLCNGRDPKVIFDVLAGKPVGTHFG